MRAGIAAFALGLVAALAAPAAAQPVVGFVENWSTADDLAGWNSGALLSNPGTGGVDGAADGFLRVVTQSPGSLGASSLLSPHFNGDYLAAGVNRVRLWLNDIEGDEALEMHFLIGNGANAWQRDAAFLPPHQAWAEFVVDLDGPTGWTRTTGTGTFQQALQLGERINIRHDRPPFVQGPDPIAGQYGIDKVLLTNTTVDVPTRADVLRPLELRAPYPNPSRGPVSLAMFQHRPGEVRIEIVDVTGRRIRSAVLPAAGAGPRTWLWDGLDQSGRRAPAGAYRVRANSRDGGMSQPLIRVE